MLKEQIFADLKTAMKEKNTLNRGVLTLIKAGLDSLEKEKGAALTQTEELSVLQRELKQTKQALEGAEKAGRADLIEKEQAKIRLIEGYLPAQLSEEEATTKLVEAGVTKGMKMGDAMKIAKATLNGQIDNKIISQIVKALIS